MASDGDSSTNALVDRIAELCEAYKKGEAGSREGLVEKCTQLVPALMTPEETMVMTTWAWPTHNAAVRLGTEMHMFEAMMADGGSPKSSGAIADSMDPPAEHLTVARILRHLSAMGTVVETDKDVFAPRAYAQALTKENYRDSVDFTHYDWHRIHMSTIDFFRQHDFKAPTSMIDSPFQTAYNCPGEHLFEYIGKHAPMMGKKFASIMDVWSTGQVYLNVVLILLSCSQPT